MAAQASQGITQALEASIHVGSRLARFSLCFLGGRTGTETGVPADRGDDCADTARALHQGKERHIVQGKPREAEGIVKVIKETRHDALQAKDFLDHDLPFVTILGDGRVYTVEEFTLTVTTISPRVPRKQACSIAFFSATQPSSGSRSGTKPSGMACAASSSARLQTGQGAPAAPQSQARSPSHGRLG
jgi:hypothetical protein